MSKHFTHLHLHTEYSLLDGAIRIKDLIKKAKQESWKAVGISDHGTISGAVKFFQEATKENIKPVLGCEMYFIPDVKKKDAHEKYYHLILIVQNKAGYQNLCRLMAYAYQEGFYFKPRIDYRILEKCSEGLAVTTACLGGHIPKLLRNGNLEEAEKRVAWFKDLFGKDRFFFELQPGDFEKQKNLNRLLLEYAGKWDVDCIATSDAHYLSLDDHEAHEVLLSVQTKDVISNPDRYTFGDCRCYVRSTDEMLAAFPDNHQLIWNTGKIADRCEFSFEFGKLFFPQSTVPAGKDPESHFADLCYQGLAQLKKNDVIPVDRYEEYDQRLAKEIHMITKMGFAGYFLVVADFVQWSKSQSIPVGPGRGSVAGALIAWALQITNVDPIKYNLLFERFLNPERITMPDIDIDFCIEGRERVINYVKEKYGNDCVCQIITFGTMMAKGVIKDVARTLGIPFQDATTITNLIPNQLKITLKEALEQEPRLKSMIESNPTVERLFAIAFKLEGLTRHASKHAAGIVISPTPLAETLPLSIPAKTKDLVAQYAMTELEALGFLKMDFLGLTNLTIIDRTLKAIEKNYGRTLDLDTLPLDDAKTLELVAQGGTNAVFQFESEGLKEVLRKLKPDKFEDLIAVNALYRPGPLGAGMVDDFIERRHGRQPISYMFDELKPILEETYGVIVYQEQVMKIASAVAGYSPGAADILRRAMGKKKVDVMAKQKELFIQGAVQRKFDAKKAEELFDLMAYFAGYGFNKSHSTAYALIAYQTAYLKANYPHEFMAASITFETNNPDKLTHYLQEINSLDLHTIAPDINRSEAEFTALPPCSDDRGILFGLQGIKNVGEAALHNIFEERKKDPFKDLLDFCKRVDLRSINKRVIESLICAGAMDSFPGNRAQKMAELEKILALAHDYKEKQLTGQMGFFDTDPSEQSEGSDLYAYKPCADWSSLKKLELEKEVAGFYLSSHPLQSYAVVKWLKSITFAQALESINHVTSINDPVVTCVGLKQGVKQITTKKGDPMAFAQFEDLGSKAEVIIFPRLYKEIQEALHASDIFVIKGAVDMTSQNKCKIKANKLVPIETLFEKVNAIAEVSLHLPSSVDENMLATLKEHCTPGTTPLTLYFNENDQALVLRSSKKVACSQALLEAFARLNIGVNVII